MCISAFTLDTPSDEVASTLDSTGTIGLDTRVWNIRSGRILLPVHVRYTRIYARHRAGADVDGAPLGLLVLCPRERVPQQGEKLP